MSISNEDGSAVRTAGVSMAEIDHDAAQLHRQLNGLDITGPRERADWVMQQCLLGCTVSDSNKVQIRDYLQMHFADLAERAKRLEDALRSMMRSPYKDRERAREYFREKVIEAEALLASKDKP